VRSVFGIFPTEQQHVRALCELWRLFATQHMDCIKLAQEKFTVSLTKNISASMTPTSDSEVLGFRSQPATRLYRNVPLILHNNFGMARDTQ
jgi:hypothetical protein